MVAGVAEATVLVAPGLVLRQHNDWLEPFWPVVTLFVVAAVAIAVLAPSRITRLVAAGSASFAVALLLSAGLWPDVVATAMLIIPALFVIRRPAPRPALPLVVVAIGSALWASDGLLRPLLLVVALVVVLQVCWVRSQAVRRADRAVSTSVHTLLARGIPTLLVAVVALPVLYLPGLFVRNRSLRGGWRVPPDTSTDSFPSRAHAAVPPQVVRRRAARSAMVGVALVGLLVGWLWADGDEVRPAQAFAVGPQMSGPTTPPPTAPPPSAPADSGGQRASESVPGSASKIDPRATNTDLRIRYGDLRVFEDAPWANDLQQEEYVAGDGRARRYVNVSGGVRRTRVSDCVGCPGVTVWLLGGSFAFGMGQRDDHTISSEMVRLAEREGVALRVDNLAVPGSTIHELEDVLARRLEQMPPPDLIVFVDGYNDVAAGLSRAAIEGFTDDPLVIDDEIQTEYLHQPVSVDPLGGPAAVADYVAQRYVATQERIQRRAARSGVPVRFFFQPDAFRNPLQLEDFAQLLSVPAELMAGSEMARTLDLTARRLEPGTVNLRPVFDAVAEPVFFGTVHTNERGAVITAESIWKRLGGAVHDLAAAAAEGGRG